MTRLLLVDFDGTLFNSDLFHKDVGEYLYNTYKIPSEDFYGAYEKSKHNGPHSLKRQLKILGLKNVSGLLKEIKALFELTSQNYIYNETLEFITKNKKEIVIYTYADPTYFKFKLAVTKLNALRLPVIAVNTNKNDFLRNNLDSTIKFKKRNKDSYNPERVLWIDDKIEGFTKNIERVEFIRIKREGGKHSVHQTPESAKEISNLLDVM